MRKGMRQIFIFLIYLLFAFYFLNYPFSFVKIPDFFKPFESGIIFFGGLLVLLGGIEYLRARKKKRELILSK
jgi:prolipoprotein diacylglyceryltransferase